MVGGATHERTRKKFGRDARAVDDDGACGNTRDVTNGADKISHVVQAQVRTPLVPTAQLKVCHLPGRLAVLKNQNVRT
jgi:hypothetical protein